MSGIGVRCRCPVPVSGVGISWKSCRIFVDWQCFTIKNHFVQKLVVLILEIIFFFFMPAVSAHFDAAAQRAATERWKARVPQSFSYFGPCQGQPYWPYWCAEERESTGEWTSQQVDCCPGLAEVNQKNGWTIRYLFISKCNQIYLIKCFLRPDVIFFRTLTVENSFLPDFDTKYSRKK